MVKPLKICQTGLAKESQDAVEDMGMHSGSGREAWEKSIKMMEGIKKDSPILTLERRSIWTTKELRFPYRPMYIPKVN